MYTHLSWTAWCNLPHDERALAVAHYRMNLLIKAHVDDASSRDAQRRAARNKAKRNLPR